MTSDTTNMNSTTTSGGTTDEARSAAQDVAGTAKDQAAQVAGETRRQARQLWEQSRDEMVQQSGHQQTRIAATLRDLGSELSSMAGASEQSGNATALVRDVGDHVSSAASWLEDKEPGDVLEELRGFARRRPGTFLLVAAGLGVLGGRLTRGAVDDSRESSESTGSGSSTAPMSTGSAGFTATNRGTGAGSGAGTTAYADGTTPYAGGTTTYAGGDTAYEAEGLEDSVPTHGRDAGGLRPRRSENEVRP